MASSKTYTIGAIIITIFATVMYAQFQDDVKFKFTKDYTEIYVNLTGAWEISGREIYPKLYNGTKLVTRSGTSISSFVDEANKIAYFYRDTNYSSGAKIKEIYAFNGNITDVEKFPVMHKIIIENAEGLIYQYEVQKLSYSGITQNFYTTTIHFDKKTSISISPDAYYSKVTKLSTGTKYIAKWKINSSSQIFFNRLYDPAFFSPSSAINYLKFYNQSTFASPRVWFVASGQTDADGQTSYGIGMSNSGADAYTSYILLSTNGSAANFTDPSVSSINLTLGGVSCGGPGSSAIGESFNVYVFGQTVYSFGTYPAICVAQSGIGLIQVKRFNETHWNMTRGATALGVLPALSSEIYMRIDISNPGYSGGFSFSGYMRDISFAENKSPTLAYTKNNSYPTVGNNISITMTTTDNFALDTCTFINNVTNTTSTKYLGTNLSAQCVFYVYTNESVGTTYNITLIVNDTSNNINRTSFLMTILPNQTQILTYNFIGGTADGNCSAWNTNTKSLCSTANSRPNVTITTDKPALCRIMTTPLTSTICYQETANISTACGGLSTGRYTYSGGFFIANYTKPSWTASALWQVKHGNVLHNLTIPSECLSGNVFSGGLQSDLFNRDTYAYCYNYTSNSYSLLESVLLTTMNYGIGADAFGLLFDENYGTAAVWDGAQWQSGGFPNPGGAIFEEAVFWNISADGDLNYTAMGPTRNCSTTNNLTHNCQAISSESYQKNGIYGLYLSCNGNEGPTSTSGDPLVYYFGAANWSIANITLNGFSQNMKYEYQTTANISAYLNESCPACSITIVCVNCPSEYGTEWEGIYNNISNNVSYRFVLLRKVNFTQGEFMATTANFTIDNRTEIDRIFFNVTGLSNPTNFALLSHNGSIIAIFPGTLIGNKIYQNEFIYSLVNYTSLNITFLTSSSQIFYVNLTTAGHSNNFTGVNFTFVLTGYESDLLNRLSYQENFTNSTLVKINTTLSTIDGPHFTFENWKNLYYNRSGRWNRTTTGSTWTTSDEGFENDSTGYFYDIDETAQRAPGGVQYTSRLFNTEFSAQQTDYIEEYFYYYLDTYSCGGASPGSCGAYQAPTTEIVFTDGTNSVTMFSLNQGCYAGDYYGTDTPLTGYANVTIYKTAENTYDVYLNGTYQSTKSTATLSSSLPWKITHYNQNYGGSDASIHAVCTYIKNKIYYVKFSGISLNRTVNGTNYTTSGQFVSSIINQTPTNITAATLTILSANIPSGTSVRYFLSNNGTRNWKETTNGTRLVFDTIGNKLAINITFNTSNINITPVITKYKIEIIPSALGEIEIDVGNDATIDVVIPQPNVTNISLPSGVLASYIQSNCDDYLSCLVPIAIIPNSSGVLQVSNLNISFNPNPINISTASYQDCSICNISSTNTAGIVNLSSLMIDFKGSWNYTWAAQAFIEGSPVSPISNYLTTLVFYTKFNVTFPSGITGYNFFPTSQNAKNVTPYGQSTSKPIWNITNYGYDSPANIYLKMNLTNRTCIDNYYVNNVSQLFNNKTFFNVTNTTVKIPFGNISSYGSKSLWSWIDLTNCSRRFILPRYVFTGICADCVVTEDFDQTDFII